MKWYFHSISNQQHPRVSQSRENPHRTKCPPTSWSHNRLLSNRTGSFAHSFIHAYHTQHHTCPAVTQPPLPHSAFASSTTAATASLPALPRENPPPDARLVKLDFEESSFKRYSCCGASALEHRQAAGAKDPQACWRQTTGPPLSYARARHRR